MLKSNRNDLILIGAILLFSGSLIFFGVKMASVFFAVPVYSCHYGVWDIAVTDYITGNDPHMTPPNGTGMIGRFDDFKCREINSSVTAYDLCHDAVPGYEYHTVSFEGNQIYSKEDLADYMK